MMFGTAAGKSCATFILLRSQHKDVGLSEPPLDKDFRPAILIIFKVGLIWKKLI
jgi:hypothetical protein